MDVKTAYSMKDSVEEIVSDIKEQLGGFSPATIIFFASSYFDRDEISKKMQDGFRKATVFGCSTAGELISGKMLKGSVVVMGLSSDLVEDLRVELLENIKQGIDLKPALSSFESHFKTPVAAMDIEKYVGIILIDGLSGAEESIMDMIGNAMDITVIGGSAGDDLKFQSTHIYANGRSYSNAALIAILKLKKGFEVIKTQSFRTTDRKLMVTRANEQGREVIEFNNKPAALAYAEAIGKTVLDSPNYFMRYPVGLIIDNEPYVRSPQRLNGKNMVFYCNILEGMEVSVLESTDIVKDTGDAIKPYKNGSGPVSGMINFNCILRTLELEKNGRTEDYGRLFSDIPTIGFSTYGEEYIGHINQTSTILLFK